MITIISINKQGNKIISYTCTNGAEIKNLTKKQVSELIDKKQVSNATKQVYKGNLIIRVKNKNVTHHSNNKSDLTQIKRIIGKQMLMGNAKKVSIYEDNYVVVSTIDDTTIVYIPEIFKADNNFNWYIIKEWSQIIEQNIKKLKIICGRNIKSTKGMFKHCHAQSLNLSSLDTSNVTNMNSMFEGCKAQNLNLSSFDTSKVTKMHEMFYCCKAQSIDLSSFDTSKVTDMVGMFAFCETQFIDLTSFDISNLTNMENMFTDCKAKSINLSSFVTSKVTKIHDMFLGCRAKVTATDKRILQEYKNG